MGNCIKCKQNRILNKTKYGLLCLDCYLAILKQYRTAKEDIAKEQAKQYYMTH